MRLHKTAPKQSEREGITMTNKTKRFPGTNGLVTGARIAFVIVCLAAAAHSQAIGTIVFQSDRDASPNTQIYSMNTDGSAVARLTNNAYNDRNPAVSHDSKKVAFVSNRNGNDDIYVMNVDGSGVAQLTSGPLDENPEWSPDGTKIAYESSPDDRATFQVWVANADGSGTQQISSGEFDVQPSFSPDGTKILFNQNYQIAVMNANGTNIAVLTALAGFNEWPHQSPNGTIVFHSTQSGYYRIYSMNADGTNNMELTHGTAIDAWPVWSPDGNFIAFQSDRSANTQIYRMAPDGSQLLRLTNNSATDTFPSWGPTTCRPCRAYVTNLLSNSVSVIDLATATVVATVPVGVSPSYTTVTPDGAKAYVAQFQWCIGHQYRDEHGSGHHCGGTEAQRYRRDAGWDHGLRCQLRLQYCVGL